MTDARFTVVIPSYNRADYIEYAIRSVLYQNLRQWKLLIVDDASTDDTIERVRPYLADPRIRLLALPVNRGISHALNAALRHVDTEAFVQLDSDDWLEVDALEQFAKAMDLHPEAALYYGNIRMWKQNEDGYWGVSRIVRHRAFEDKYDFLVYMKYMLHPRCYRTASVRSVGGWDTNDPYDGRFMEDRRMCVKLIGKYRFYWIDRILYNRRRHARQLTSESSIPFRNRLRRELVLRTLEQWGNQYRPVFGYRKRWLIVKKLKPVEK